MALNDGVLHFGIPDVDGLIAFRLAGRRHLVQLGGVFSAAQDQGHLLDDFLAMAQRLRRRVVAVQLLRADAERYAARGFTVNQLGASYARSLPGFSLKGSAHMRLRNKVSRARRAGIDVAEVPVDVPRSAELEAELDEIDAQWLRSKGRHVKEMAFMVGERRGRAAALRRLFCAVGPQGEVLGYITFSPVFGRHSGWLHDLSRRHPGAPPGTMELVVLTAIERFRVEGAGHLHFGLTPFTELDDQHELSARSRVAARLLGLLAAHGDRIYPATSQVAYKMKWGPDLIQPEYIGFSEGMRPGAVWSLLRLTNVL